MNRWLAAFVIFAAIASVQAADVPATVEQRLQRLEQEVESLREENRALREQLGLDKKSPLAFVVPAGKESKFALGGLIQAQAEFGDKGDARFTSDHDRIYLRRARLNATGELFEHFDFRIELDLAGSLGESTNLRAQLTDAFINWHQFEPANLKAGQFKTSFGFEQLYSDSRLFTIERSLPNDRLTIGRQLGVQAAGQFLDKRLSYATGVFNGDNLNNNFNDNNQFEFVERVAGVPWRGKFLGQESQWSVGASYFHSDTDSLTGMPAEFGFDSTPATLAADNVFAGYRQGVTFDTQWRVGHFDFWAEYLRNRFRPHNNIPSRGFDSDGWYAQGAFFVVPKKLQAVVKFESFDPNRAVAGDSTDLWTFGATWFFHGDDLRLQLNYQLVNAAGEPDDRSKILLRLQAMF